MKFRINKMINNKISNINKIKYRFNKITYNKFHKNK